MPNSINIYDLNESQELAVEALEDGYDTLVLVGPVRQGKTAVACHCMFWEAIENREMDIGNGEYIVAGPTSSGVIRNTVGYFEDLCDTFDEPFRLKSGGSSPTMEIGGCLFHIFGGENKRSYTRVKGATIHSLSLIHI